MLLMLLDLELGLLLDILIRQDLASYGIGVVALGSGSLNRDRGLLCRRSLFNNKGLIQGGLKEQRNNELALLIDIFFGLKIATGSTNFGPWLIELLWELILLEDVSLRRGTNISDNLIIMTRVDLIEDNIVIAKGLRGF